MANVSYEFGERLKSAKFTAPLVWRNAGPIEGVLVWARDESRGDYVRVYEVGPSDPDGWIQGIYEGSYSRGNFETIESARAMAGKAYRWMNKAAKRAA